MVGELEVFMRSRHSSTLRRAHVMLPSQGRMAGGSAVARVGSPQVHSLFSFIPGLLESSSWLRVLSGCF